MGGWVGEANSFGLCTSWVIRAAAEAAAVELGKEKGKAVMMLVHHSRSTEQKQW
jgi:hypothetical protein